jgi:hypothetical protein
MLRSVKSQYYFIKNPSGGAMNGRGNGLGNKTSSKELFYSCFKLFLLPLNNHDKHQQI